MKAILDAWSQAACLNRAASSRSLSNSVGLLGSERIFSSAYVLFARSIEVAIAVPCCSRFAEIREVIPDGPEDVFPGRRRVFEAFQTLQKFAIQETVEVCHFGAFLPQPLRDRLI